MWVSGALHLQPCGKFTGSKSISSQAFPFHGASQAHLPPLETPFREQGGAPVGGAGAAAAATAAAGPAAAAAAATATTAGDCHSTGARLKWSSNGRARLGGTISARALRGCPDRGAPAERRSVHYMYMYL